MLKAILFDLDHTLYDREASLQRMMPDFWDKVREYINDGVSFERFKELMIEAEHLHNYHTWKDRLEYMDSHGALKKYPDQEEYRYIFNSTMGPFCVNYDFTFKLLSDIRDMGYKTGLVTNGFTEIQETKLKTLGLSGCFDTICICGMRGKQKPEPEPFLETAEALNMRPEECIYVGDNPRNDILGAKRVGMKTLWVATLGPWKYYEYPRPDYAVVNVGELGAILPVIAKDME